MWLADPQNILRVLGPGLVAYGLLILFLRLGGKRSLAKLNAFDFVVTIAIGSILANVLTGTSLALSQALLAVGLLIMLQTVVSWLSVRSDAFQDLIRACPRILLKDGVIDEQALKEERVTRGDLMQVLRDGGFGRLDEVAAVVLEANGTLNTIGKREGRDALETLEDVKGA